MMTAREGKGFPVRFCFFTFYMAQMVRLLFLVLYPFVN